MIMDHHETSTGLPENSHRELKNGESYTPLLDPNTPQREVTPWSVFWGIIMAILFSAAAAYSGLKIGQVMEAGIPIAILAVGISSALRNQQTLGQNVIIQSIGATSSGVVAGAIFTIPALYILDLSPHFYQIFLAALLGGFFGILFVIPFRKYFVKDRHGELPFPEATAATGILIAGERGGKQAWILVISGLIGGLNDFVVSSLGWWSDTITSRIIPGGEFVADKLKIVFKMDALAMIVGFGYLIGLRYSMIICAGSFFSWFVFIPLLHEIGQGLTTPYGAMTTHLIASMSPTEIFSNYVQPIGIGCIAMAGIIGILRSYKVMINSFGLAFISLFHWRKPIHNHESRWQTDIKIPFVLISIILLGILTFIFFEKGVVFNVDHALIGVGIVLVISFLFTTVAMNAIATVGQNPVSGMTLMTLILTAFILNYFGISGKAGLISALIIGGVVCTALSMAGTFITDLKIGYWVGSTPKKQETWKFVGTLVSAATIIFVIQILNDAYGFKGPNALMAPQANAMAAIVKPLMSHVAVSWMLYLIGAFIAVLMTMIEVPALAFALGMYLPLELNTPLLIGGLVAWGINKSTKNQKLKEARSARGMLIASGFIAGGALFGVLGTLLKFFGINWFHVHWSHTHSAQILTVVMFTLLTLYMVWDALRAKIKQT